MNRRVLIVDDEKNIRLTLRQALQALEGVEVETASDGEEALAKIGGADFGAVLLDLRLPGIQGLEVLTEARRLRPELRVIILTAYGTVDAAVEAMKLGAADFLQKPFTPDEITGLVWRVLERSLPAMAPADDYAGHMETAKKHINDEAFVDAAEHVRKAIATDPNQPEAFNLLGGLLEIEGDNEGARKNYRVALALDPRYEPALVNLRRVTGLHPKGEMLGGSTSRPG